MPKDDFFERLGDFIDRSRQNIKDRLTLDVTDLIRAVDANSQEEVERVLRAGVDPNTRDGLYRLALPMATDANNAEIVKLLLEAKAKPNLRDPQGDTALYKAVYWENETIIEMLLEAGADPRQPNGKGITPLEEAQRINNTGIAALLQEFQDEKRAKARAADRAKHEELKAKAAEARKRREAAAQAEKAAKIQKQKQAEEKAQQEIEKLYDVQGDDYLRPLLKAMQSKDTEAVKVFIERSKDINGYDVFYNTTPLMMAIQMQNTKLASYLIEKGADPMAYVKQLRHSPFTKAVSRSMYELVQGIITKHADSIAATMNDSEQVMSPQLLAYKDARMLDILIGAGADPFWGGVDMPAPVIKAIEKASIAILPVLVRHQVDINQMTDGKTPLAWAISYNRTDWVTGLLSEGANYEKVDDAGKDALAFADSLEDREAIIAILRDEIAED